MFRLFQLSDSVPSLAGFVSFSHRIRLHQPPQPSHSANAFDSFSHRSRLIQPTQPYVLTKWSRWTSVMKYMNSRNEVDELAWWSSWFRHNCQYMQLVKQKVVVRNFRTTTFAMFLRVNTERCGMGLFPLPPLQTSSAFRDVYSYFYDSYTKMFCCFYYHIYHALCNWLIISK